MTLKPLDFIATLDSMPVHIVLFYEDEEYARKIEYSFMRNGLARSQHCIYTTHEEDGIEGIRTEMMEHGIDVNKFEASGLLHILTIKDPCNDPAGLEKGIEKLTNRILEGKKPPIRLVSRYIKEVEAEEDARANMLVESLTHSCFHDFKGLMLMCPYPVDRVAYQVSVEWFLNHMQHHHVAVFAPKTFEGSALVLDKQQGIYSQG